MNIFKEKKLIKFYEGFPNFVLESHTKNETK